MTGIPKKAISLPMTAKRIGLSGRDTLKHIGADLQDPAQVHDRVLGRFGVSVGELGDERLAEPGIRRDGRLRQSPVRDQYGERVFSVDNAIHHLGGQGRKPGRLGEDALGGGVFSGRIAGAGEKGVVVTAGEHDDVVSAGVDDLGVHGVSPWPVATALAVDVSPVAHGDHLNSVFGLAEDHPVIAAAKPGGVLTLHGSDVPGAGLDVAGELPFKLALHLSGEGPEGFPRCEGVEDRFHYSVIETGIFLGKENYNHQAIFGRAS